MADEKPPGSSPTDSSGSGRKGNRRRNSRNRKRSRRASGGGAETTQPVKGETAIDGAERSRRDRRRRRRSKKTEEASSSSHSPTQMDDELGILPVGSVSVYTHVIRPSIRDSYEFRSEHFSKVSRRLEDFRIDLSILFPEERDADQQEDMSLEQEDMSLEEVIDDLAAGSEE